MSYCIIILNLIFQKIANQSYLLKIFLIMHHKCAQADIAHNSVNRSNNEQLGKLKQISTFKQT